MENYIQTFSKKAKVWLICALSFIVCSCSEEKVQPQKSLVEEEQSVLSQAPTDVQKVEEVKKPEPPFLQIDFPTENLIKNTPLKATLTIQGKFENPFDTTDVSIDAMISWKKDTQIIHWPVYFVEGTSELSRWKLNAPLLGEGKYKCKFIYRDKEGFKESEEFEFTVNAQDKAGIFKPVKKMFFAFKDDSGKVFRGMGANLSLVNDADLTSSILALAQEKCNLIRFDLGKNWESFLAEDILADAAEPEENGDEEIVDNAIEKAGFFNVELFNKLELSLDFANENNMQSIISFIDADSFAKEIFANSYFVKSQICGDAQSFFAERKVKDYYKNFMRYMVARFAARSELVAWDLYSGIDRDNKQDFEKRVLWVDEISAFLREIDATQRSLIVSASTSSAHDSLWYSMSADIIGLESYNMKNFGFTIFESSKYFTKKYAKPLVFMSYGVTSDKAGYPDKDNMMLHDSLWAGLFSQTPILPLASNVKALSQSGSLSNFKSVAEFVSLYEMRHENLQTMKADSVQIFARKGENQTIIYPAFMATYPDLATADDMYKVKVNSAGKILENTLSLRLTDLNPQTLFVNMGKVKGKVIVDISAVRQIDEKFDFVILVDGVESLRKNFDNIKGDVVQDGDYSKILTSELISIAIEEGEHEITFELKSKNWQNPAFVEIASITIENLGSMAGVSAVDVLGLIDSENNKRFFWFKRMGTSSWGFFKYKLAERTIPDLKPFEYSVDGLNPTSNYKISWFDTFTGKEIISGVVATDDKGKLTFNVAAFKYDISCCIEESN